jgi:drug/metabolite transporter (DMT)-like permease
LQPKQNIDALGAGLLIAFSLFLGFNQVLIKFTTDGFQPVFMAALRSVGAVFCTGAWVYWRGIKFDFSREMLHLGALMGALFAFEFIFLFVGLDLTTVARSSVIFYSMPVWLAIGAHFFLPDDNMTTAKAAGLYCAFIGVAVAIFGRGEASEGSLIGDLCSLVASIAWAGLALCARGTALKKLRPEMQAFYQVTFSVPFLIIAAPFFGPLVRDLEPIHWASLAFQTVFVVSAGYMFWLWLLSIYPASGVASFSFLGPIFGVFLGWLLLGESIGIEIVVSLVLVALGLWLINKPSRPAKSLLDEL